MLRPKALDHVGLKATDLDKSLHFYQTLGLELLRTSGPSANGGRSAVLKVGDQEIHVFYHSDFVSADKGDAGRSGPLLLQHATARSSPFSRWRGRILSSRSRLHRVRIGCLR